MDLASLLLACSVHADDALLAAVVQAHGANAYTVRNVHLGVLTSQDEPLETSPLSLGAAQAEVARILAAGGIPVVGLLPVRLEWAAEFDKTPAQLFDACANVAVSSAQISAFDYECRGKGPRSSSPARRACTLSRYGASVGLPGLPHVVLSSLSDAAPTDGIDLAPSLELAGDAAAAPPPGLFFALAPLTPPAAFEAASPSLPPLAAPQPPPP